MNITLYKVSDPKNAITKTLLIADSSPITGATLKAPTDILSPTLTIKRSRFQTISTWWSYNYVYIPDFSRYYFIDSITLINNDLISLSLREDVLFSFKSTILANAGFVGRSGLGSTKLPDDLIQFSDDWDISVSTPASGTLVDTTFDPSMTGSKRNIVVTCIAKDTSVITGIGDTSFVISSPNIQGLPNVNMYRMDADRFSFNYVFNKADFETFSNDIFGSATLYSYIKNVMTFPFEPPLYKSGGSVINLSIVLGEQSLGYSTPITSSKSISPYLVVADFEIASSSYFYDYEPYTKIELFIPYCGYIDVSPSQVRGCRLVVYYQVNYSDGSASAQVYNKTKDCLVWQGTCQLGLSIALSYANEQEVADKRTASTLNAILGGFTSGIAGIAGMASGHPIAGLAGGLLGITKAISGHITNDLTNYQRGNVGCISGANGLLMPQSVTIRYSKKTAIAGNYATASEVWAEFGKPDARVRTLSTLEGTGYAEVSGMVFEYFTQSVKPNAQEVNEIENLLKTGVVF